MHVYDHQLLLILGKQILDWSTGKQIGKYIIVRCMYMTTGSFGFLVKNIVSSIDYQTKKMDVYTFLYLSIVSS